MSKRVRKGKIYVYENKQTGQINICKISVEAITKYTYVEILYTNSPIIKEHHYYHTHRKPEVLVKEDSLIPIDKYKDKLKLFELINKV